MKTLFLLVAVVLTFAQFQVIAHGAENSPLSAGMPLKSQDGHTLGMIYKVTSEGAVQLIIDGRMVTLPSSTLSVDRGSATTSLKKSEVYRLR